MRYVGLVLLVVGLAFLGLSYYTTDRVDQETSTAYKATSELSDNPMTELGGPVAEDATKEVGSAANVQVANNAMPYEQMAAYEHTIGLILVVLGAVIALFFIARRLFR